MRARIPWKRRSRATWRRRSLECVREKQRWNRFRRWESTTNTSWTSTRFPFSKRIAKNRAPRRRLRGKSKRSRSNHEKQDRAARSAATSALILQRGGDAFQANNDCFNATSDDDKTCPIENGKSRGWLWREKKREPRAHMQRDHAPRLRHYSAKLALNADRLSEQTNVRGEHRENCCPISDQRIH